MGAVRLLTVRIWQNDPAGPLHLGMHRMLQMRTKIVQTTHSIVSKDGKTMTLVTKTASGQPVSTRVYVKK